MKNDRDCHIVEFGKLIDKKHIVGLIQQSYLTVISCANQNYTAFSP